MLARVASVDKAKNFFAACNFCRVYSLFTSLQAFKRLWTRTCLAKIALDRVLHSFLVQKTILYQDDDEKT